MKIFRFDMMVDLMSHGAILHWAASVIVKRIGVNGGRIRLFCAAKRGITFPPKRCIVLLE
jgi:hypothetical protein